MTNHTPKPSRGRSLSIAVGALLVPLSALVAVALSNGPDVSAEVETTTTSEPVGEVVPSLESDVQAACGASGLDLVTKEQQGSITDFQQSALDALRPICSAAGLPLPGGTTTVPAPTIEASSAPPPTTAQTVDDRDDDDHDYDHGEDDHDDEGHGDHAGDDD